MCLQLLKMFFQTLTRSLWNEMQMFKKCNKKMFLFISSSPVKLMSSVLRITPAQNRLKSRGSSLNLCGRTSCVQQWMFVPATRGVTSFFSFRLHSGSIAERCTEESHRVFNPFVAFVKKMTFITSWVNTWDSRHSKQRSLSQMHMNDGQRHKLVTDTFIDWDADLSDADGCRNHQISARCQFELVGIILQTVLSLNIRADAEIHKSWW